MAVHTCTVRNAMRGYAESWEIAADTGVTDGISLLASAAADTYNWMFDSTRRIPQLPVSVLSVRSVAYRASLVTLES